MIKRWKWTADDQNFVANLIAGQHMDPDEGRGEVGEGEPGQGQGLAREVAELVGGGGRVPQLPIAGMSTPTFSIHQPEAADARSLWTGPTTASAS